MNTQLYRVNYTVQADFEDIVRSTYVFAVSATSAAEWIRRYWRHKHHRHIDVKEVCAISPMVGKVIATTWASS